MIVTKIFNKLASEPALTLDPSEFRTRMEAEFSQFRQDGKEASGSWMAPHHYDEIIASAPSDWKQATIGTVWYFARVVWRWHLSCDFQECEWPTNRPLSCASL